MAVWVVRAGRLGEQEAFNLEKGRATVGWREVGDLRAYGDRSALAAAVAEAFPGDSAARLGNFTGQLWAFSHDIAVGDLVLMPLKTSPGQVQFGRATGPYGYDASQADRSARHFIPVDWQAEPIAKTAIGGDLVSSMNAIKTVFKVSRNNADERLAETARTGTDPGLAVTDPDGEPPTAHGEGGLVAPTDPTAGDVATAGSSHNVIDPESVPTIEAVRDRIRTYVGDTFREHALTGLVADILGVLGFQCEVSPPGPDGGVDIIGGMGPLGLDAPTLIVEVKSERTPVDVKVVRGLHSAMTQHRADQALLVAWGGVTKPARQEFQRDRTSLRIWTAEDLLDKVFETYDRLPATTRARLPLAHVWVLDQEE